MKIQITAGGIYDGEGKEVPIGTTYDVKDEPTAWAGRYTVVTGDSEAKTAITNEPVELKGPFTAKEKSPGWWAIFDGAGEPVGKAVREDALKGFDDLSEDDKLAFATEHAKA